MTSQNGKTFGITMMYGHKRMRMINLFWIMFKPSSLKMKDVKLAEILCQVCLSLIQKQYKMPTVQRKKVMTEVKKKTGVKIHIGVDILGLPYANIITTANVTDRNGAIEMFSQPSFSLPTLKTVLCDGGYTGKNFADAIRELTGAEVQVAKRSELHTFAVIPKRWIVERTFGWLDKCRRLWKNCERKLENTLNMFKLAIVSLLLKRF